MLHGCFVLLSIVSWMSLVLTAVLKGIIAVEMGVLALVIGILVLAMGGRRIMRLIIPIAGLLVLLYSVSGGSSAAFVASLEVVSVLGITCVGYYVMFRGLRGPRT